jgi:hypothetical protein
MQGRLTGAASRAGENGVGGRCKYPELVAFLILGLLTNPYHLLRLLDLRGSHL